MNERWLQQSVLVVDDERFVLKTTAYILQRLGFTNVLTAETGDAALRHIDSADPPVGLVLSDLNMPEMDGVELLRRFDEQGYRGDIVLFSGEDSQTLNMAESLARARKLSVLGSLAKPVQVEQLTALLNNHSEAAASAKPRAEQLVTAAMLEAAIKAGELEPWFQPKIDIASREPVGVEALARWPNSVVGPVFPDTFIPLAEKHCLIDPLTFALVKKVAEIADQWAGQGINLKVAINVSMDSLNELDFPNRIGELLQGHGGDAGAFQLEVTESRLMEDLVRPLDVLLRLRLKKIRFSIDDFGTGHSNLTQLRDLPFDELKLDRSYIQGAAENESTRAILESTVEMAKKLDKLIVAEGVETLEDWNRVEQLGCDQVQGYFTARPMPGDEIPNWVASWPEKRAELFGD
ncbi:MAG: EAL domain-containing response regulator [Candidatus Sedimenticola sp. 4PFRAG1]